MLTSAVNSVGNSLGIQYVVSSEDHIFPIVFIIIAKGAYGTYIQFTGFILDMAIIMIGICIHYTLYRH